MVCKRSLYCWKNGPCANDQTRKQIWEDNIRFRESLRDINQSDHYWSFQISKNKCLCLEGEDVYYSRPLSRRHRSSSLQQLHQIDCASVTHDYNGLKIRNCFVHCPIHDFSRKTEQKRADTPIPKTVTKAEPLLCAKYPLQPVAKSDGDRPEYCHRYKNTLTSTLKPCIKTKFLSQTNLNCLHDTSSTLNKKSFHASCDSLRLKALENRIKSPVPKSEKSGSEKLKEVQVKKDEPGVEKAVVKVKKPKKELNPIINPPSREKLRNFTPVSRTTRKMLNENKQIPFITFGCNNKNNDIGSKRTHNVLASKMEVYPNALSAKQKKKDWIMRYIQSEKEFQKKCLPENLRKRLVNHSSLWSLDKGTREEKQRKNTRYVFPLMNKPLKKINVKIEEGDSCRHSSYQKPKVYFY